MSISQKALEKRIQLAHEYGADRAEHCICYIIIGNWSLSAYLNCLSQFLKSLSAEEKAGWMANFTKTIFLFGNPKKLTRNIKFTAEIDNIAMLLSKVTKQQKNLLGLLRKFDTNVFDIKMRQELFSAPSLSQPKYELHFLDTAFEMRNILVDAHHILSEACINQEIETDDLIKTKWLFSEMTKAPADAIAVRSIPTDDMTSIHLKAILKISGSVE